MHLPGAGQREEQDCLHEARLRGRCRSHWHHGSRCCGERHSKEEALVRWQVVRRRKGAESSTVETQGEPRQGQKTHERGAFGHRAMQVGWGESGPGERREGTWGGGRGGSPQKRPSTVPGKLQAPGRAPWESFGRGRGRRVCGGGPREGRPLLWKGGGITPTRDTLKKSRAGKDCILSVMTMVTDRVNTGASKAFLT